MTAFSESLQCENDIKLFAATTYAVLRPTYDTSEGETVITFADNAQEYHIMAGLTDGPARAIAFQGTLVSAMADLVAIQHERPELKLYYNGNEALVELCGDPWLALAETLGKIYEDWGVVHRVCTGQTRLDDPEASQLFEDNPVHAAAIAAVFQRLALASEAAA